jgi:uncharacterized protein
MISLKTAKITPEGLEGEIDGFAVKDREYMIVLKDPDNYHIHNFVTQRKTPRPVDYLARGIPELALIIPKIISGRLYLTWKNEDEIHIDTKNSDSGSMIKAGIWGNVIDVVDQGDEIAYWLSNHLNTQVRLVKKPESFQRNVSQSYAINENTLRCQDGYPVHWLMEETIMELSKLCGLSFSSLKQRFRPNIVACGGDARSEYIFHTGKINNVPFMNPKPCDRCPTPTVDQEIGKITGKEPLESLGKYMRWRNRKGEPKVIFGENMLPLGTGEIHLGR